MQALDWASLARRSDENCAAALTKATKLPPGVALKAFIRAATDVGPMDHYKRFGNVARGMIEQIRALQGDMSMRAFLRAALERTISTCVASGQYQRLPPRCAHHQFEQLRRIADDSDAGAEWLDLGDDRFQKEFGIASTRLYVAGSNLVDYRCGIPRSIVFQEGPRKIFATLRAMSDLGGFRPYFQGHLHTFLLDALNEEGRNEFYRCCADLYALHPRCLGMFCASWYYDPALDKISPWLSYLRTVPLAGGAYLFRVQDGGEAIGNATAKSRARRKLYEEGKYLPRTYMIAWGKRQQIEWTHTHPAV